MRLEDIDKTVKYDVDIPDYANQIIGNSEVFETTKFRIRPCPNFKYAVDRLNYIHMEYSVPARFGRPEQFLIKTSEQWLPVRDVLFEASPDQPEEETIDILYDEEDQLFFRTIEDAERFIEWTLEHEAALKEFMDQPIKYIDG